MQDDSEQPSINSWLEDELLSQYRYNRQAVDSSWSQLFEGNGHGQPRAPENGQAPPKASAAPTMTMEPPRELAAPEPPPVGVSSDDQLVPLRGPALRIAENMSASLTIPVATSQRAMPVKVIDENRRLINQYRGAAGASKLSYTHLVAWAIVRALDAVPALNQAYSASGTEAFRVTRGHVNLGIAVDVAGRDGSRSLKVPSIKQADKLNFAQFVAAYDDLVQRARQNKLTVADFENTTISLTNPGTVGTVGSIPRLMPGQGAIIATGAIDFPPEYRGVPDDVRSSMGLSKVMMVTCTYDHRVIQGAESGTFLAHMQGLLEGEASFYDDMLRDLGISARAWKWEADQASSPVVNSDPLKQAGVAHLIDAWRERGHLAADINPLSPDLAALGKSAARISHPELEPSGHGLTIWDLDRSFHCGTFGVMTLRALMDRLRAAYAGKAGVQYMHIANPEERQWIMQRVESIAQWELEPAARIRTLKEIVLAEGFETFLENRFKGAKRFSLEGGEAMIAMIEDLLDRAASSSIHEVVIGMAHRGRLTLLANVIGKGVAQMFSEFDGDIDPLQEGTGDVKYHLGETSTRKFPDGSEIIVSVAANPSHLEAVNPVVEGIVRPKQDRLGDVRRERVIPFLIHGDAAMSGQGIVAETLNFSQIEGYNTGGTLHLVINNQIGFTTDPRESRSTEYCTDIAMTVQAPVIHVNGDDPEACVWAMRLAMEYRQKFHRDVVVDMVCYRKHGHNEGDDASFTQPILSKAILAHKPVAASYTERLVDDGVVTAAEVAGWREAQKKRLYEIYDQTQKTKEEFELHEMVPIPPEELPTEVPPTAVSRGVLDSLLEGVTRFPQDFHLHPKLSRLVERRRSAHQGANVDWALAETLAFGSLLLEGTPVRLSGQDSARGTFSQRHAAFYDYESGKPYIPLQHLAAGQANFEVHNSPLSEFGILGFEFGYSVADPLALVLWEAQYGDFVNGAQVIIDQFITSAESKWSQPSGLTMLLPHGQEGGGPEHSSARLERFLQSAAERNIQVVFPTTPAQYFHVLRRQMRGGPDKRGLRKPLILMTAKSLLRHPKCVSSLDELVDGAFHPVVADETVADPSQIRRILLCAGKVYYELLAERETRGATDVALVRLPQLYPFPKPEVAQILRLYGNANEVIWVQEEPRNMGAWPFIRGRITPLLEARHMIGYAGRPESASTAPGSMKRHQREQQDVIDAAFAPPSVARLYRKKLVRRMKAR